MAFDIVVGGQRVDQIQTVCRMGDRVAAGVAHLVFFRILFDVFRLIGDAGLDVVMTGPVRADQFETHHVGSQIVALMFHIGSHAEVLLCLRVVEPVLPHDVIRFLLFRMEG